MKDVKSCSLVSSSAEKVNFISTVLLMNMKLDQLMQKPKLSKNVEKKNIFGRMLCCHILRV